MTASNLNELLFFLFLNQSLRNELAQLKDVQMRYNHAQHEISSLTTRCQSLEHALEATTKVRAFYIALF